MKDLSHECVSTRRQVLRGAGIAVAVAAGGSTLTAGKAALAAPAQTPLRIVQLTDIHLQPKRRAPEGLAACLHHVQEHYRPQMIIGTGDAIMDSSDADEARVKLQWELWKRVWKAESDLPIEHCLGNHDVWGLNKKNSKTHGSEPRYGKKWVMEINGWERPYRSFDRAGWHFVALDSVMPAGDSYVGKFDDEQFEWLADDLARADASKPVCLFSHIPIFSAAAFYDGEHEKSGNWNISASIMHIDARRVKDLFRKHPNVKLCLSGHLHLVDRVDYLGVTYLCNGAVCGGWWKGSHQECEPGYGVIDLHPDGRIDNQYVTYGWKAE